MNYSGIIVGDVGNGQGLRVSVFFSGCTHHCPGCFNEENQDFQFGEKYTKHTEDTIVGYFEKYGDYLQGLSLLGGEPLDQCPKGKRQIMHLINRVKGLSEDFDVWLWSGYTKDEILADRDKIDIVSCCDVLIDGRFERNRRDVTLKHRGSSNQKRYKIKGTIKGLEFDFLD